MTNFAFFRHHHLDVRYGSTALHQIPNCTKITSIRSSEFRNSLRMQRTANGVAQLFHRGFPPNLAIGDPPEVPSLMA